MKKAIFLNTNQNGYEPDQCGRTMTVEELISLLEDFDSDRKILDFLGKLSCKIK